MNEKNDTEVGAMSSIVDALEGLEDEKRQRVLRWACDRYGVQLGRAVAKRVGPPGSENEEVGFGDIATLYDAASPKTDAERALVAGYWYQQLEGRADLDAQTVNKALKNLGHGISNITWALMELQKGKPALVLQTHKSGKSKQARKKYKLTEAGIRTVKRMVAGQQLEEE